MNALNSLIVEGNCTQFINFGVSPKGVKFGEFSIATNRRYKGADGKFVDEVSFFKCVAFGKMAEVCEKELVKGRGVRIVGYLKQSRWTDSNGKNNSSISVVCEHIEFKPMLKKDVENVPNDVVNDIPFSTDENGEEMMF